jgi:COMPASS component SWD3
MSVLSGVEDIVRGVENVRISGSASSGVTLQPKVTISALTSEVFCVRFSPDGKFLAAGCGDGAIRVFNVANGNLAYNLQGGSNVALPTTALRFRPVTPTTRTKNVFLAANAAGTVQHWHMTSGKCLHSMEEPENQVYALDYNTEGTHFAAAGKDTCVRIFDEATKSCTQTMRGGLGYGSKASPGHSNRVFSVKFVPGDDNMVVSGGWDNTVQIWDLRTGCSVRSFYGPHVCGDSVDVCGGEIVTGSWRPDTQLEIWDYGTGTKKADIPWNAAASYAALSGQPACMLYSAQFSKEGAGRYIAAGGSGTNECKVFDHLNNNEVIGTVSGLSRGVFTIDFSPDNEKMAIAGGDASIRILHIGKKEDE